MKKYKINSVIMLGFLTPQDQYDLSIGPNDSYSLEANDTTIWLVYNKTGKRSESITTINAIQYWLDDGAIEENNWG